MKLISFLAVTTLLQLLNPNLLLGKSARKLQQHSAMQGSPGFVCGAYPNRLLDHLVSEKIHVARRFGLKRMHTPVRTSVIGNLVVIEDNETLIREPRTSPFDLDGRQLHFMPNANGGYDITFVPMDFDTAAGIDVNAGDDTHHRIDFSSGFSFPYFGTDWDHVWIHANGRVTFGHVDDQEAFDHRDFFAEIPMIAVLFTDLDPTESGLVQYRQETDRFIVTWDGITEFGSFNSNTVQLTLDADGSFTIAFKAVGIRVPVNGFPLIIGFNSGKPNVNFQAVDLSHLPISSTESDVLFEDFDQTFYREVNIALTAQQFYAVQPDSFDQLVLFTNFDLLDAPFTAFHVLVGNDISGIGREMISDARLFGSAGRLQSFIHMNDINSWPDLPDEFSLTVLGHETGHRWGAFVRFDKNGEESDLLLGSGLVHWSYYLDTDGSVLFGNGWRDNHDGTFRSVRVLDNYSFLDLYLMGLRAPEEVPWFFLIDIPGLTPQQRSAFPRKGVVVTGPKRRVTIQDITAVEGPRVPQRQSAQKVFRQGYLLLTRQGVPPSAAEMSKAESLRGAFPRWFSERTDGRGIVQTHLGAGLPVAGVEGVVSSAFDGRIVQSFEAQLLERAFWQPVPAGGYYAFRILGDPQPSGELTVTMVHRAFPFVPDTTKVPLRFGETLALDKSMTPLPSGVLEGRLRDETGRGVKAKLTLYVSSDLTDDFTVTDSSDSEGRFAFEELLISVPQLVKYEKLQIDPEIPYVAETLTDIMITEGMTTLPDLSLSRADVLVVNDDEDRAFEGFYLSALDSLGLHGHVWRQRERGVAPVSRMNEFRSQTIIWYTGNAAGSDVITETERDSLAAYLDGGGSLFLTGQNIAQSLAGSQFLANRLQVSFLGTLNDFVLHGVKNDPVGNGLRSINIFGTGGATNQTSVDVLLVRGEHAFNSVVFDTTSVTSAAAGIRVEDPANNSRLVLFGFGFEAITAGAFPRPGFATRKDVMRNVLRWLSDLATSVPASRVGKLIDEFALLPNYPNPFNSETVIRYRIPDHISSAEVRLEIFNILGRKVRTLVDEELPPGDYSVRWDGRDDSGAARASGVYWVKFSANQYRQVEKVLFVK